MIRNVYFVNVEDLKGYTLYYAHIAFCVNGQLQIEYEYDDSINDELKDEALWFDRLTYTF